MKHKRLVAIVYVLACLSSRPVRASNEEVGFGARSMGMADALTADSEDLSGLALNPAAVGHLRRPQVEAGIRNLHHIPAGPTDLNGMVVGVGVPLTNPSFRGALGLSWTHDILSTRSLDRTIGLTYATRSWREIGPGTLDFGLTGKNIRRSGENLGGKVSKMGVDFGTLYRWGDDRAFGLSLLNLNSPHTDLDGVDDVAPLVFRCGFVQRVRRFTVGLDYSKREPSNGYARYEASDSGAIGMEHAWGTPGYGILTARSGLALGRRVRTWNLGAGWTLLGVNLDYAVRIPMAGGPKWGHAVSLSYRFGTWDPESEYEKLLRGEMRYRQELARALESAEVKQWKLAEDIRLMRKEMEDLRNEAMVKEIEAGEAQGKLKAAERTIRLREIQEKQRAAEKRLKEMAAEQERLREQDKNYRFQREWRAYLQLKNEGVSEIVLRDRLKRNLREFQETGVDLGEANEELKRLLMK